MLLNNFYYIKDQTSESDKILASISFNPLSPIFEGHFQGQPVVPGVCMVQIVKELLEAELQQSLILQSCDQIKFLQMVIPNTEDRYVVSISYLGAENEWKVQAQFSKDNNTVFKLQGRFIGRPSDL